MSLRCRSDDGLQTGQSGLDLEMAEVERETLSWAAGDRLSLRDWETQRLSEDDIILQRVFFFPPVDPVK